MEIPFSVKIWFRRKVDLAFHIFTVKPLCQLMRLNQIKELARFEAEAIEATSQRLQSPLASP